MSGFLSVIRDLSAFCTLHFACKQVTFCVQSYIGELYKDIEKQYGKSTAAIERSTRSAIVSGWEKMKPVDKQMLFESCLANGTKPTNAMYINTIALYIKHLYNDQLEMYYKNKNDHT